MIKYHKCKTAKCEEQSTHTNPINGFCYCSKWALRLHSLDQCKRIGDPETINYALSTSINMITKMKEYIERKDLSESWNYMIPELDHFAI